MSKTKQNYEEDFVMRAIWFLARHHNLKSVICSSNRRIDDVIEYNAIYNDHLVTFYIDTTMHWVTIKTYGKTKAETFGRFIYVKHDFAKTKCKSFRHYYNRPREPSQQAEQ